MNKFWPRVVALFICLAVVAVAVVLIMRSSPEAAEVVTGAFGLLASIFTSPFILEATLGLIGFVIVLTYNQYRRERDEKDEWVLLPRTGSSDGKADAEE